MGLDPVAAFMLGMIVGQWLAILMILKVVKAVLNRPGGISAEPAEPPDQAALITRLISKELLGIAKPRGERARGTPPPARKSTRRGN